MIKDNKLEPVAEVGSTYTLLWAGSETITAIHERSGVKVGSMLVTVEQAEAHTAAKVREALEEALLVAENEWRENLYDFPYPKIIKGIRALIQKQTGDCGI